MASHAVIDLFPPGARVDGDGELVVVAAARGSWCGESYEDLLRLDVDP
jgi:hypothetical protein